MGVDQQSIKQLKNLQKKFERLEQKDKDDFYEYLSKQVALRFLSYVIPDTPTQENKVIDTGYKTYDIKGGALKRGWIGLTDAGEEPSQGEIDQFVQNLPVKKAGTRRFITIANNVSYAPYVEYGHRQRPGRYVPVIPNSDGGYGAQLTSAWVPGQFMLKRAVKNTGSVIPGLMHRLVNVWMKDYFK